MPSSSTSAPHRRCVGSRKSLLATLGTAGPILVYTPYERRVLRELAARYPDLGTRARRARGAHRRSTSADAPALLSTREMQGSWSIKNVLPTVAADFELQHARRRPRRLRGTDGVSRGHRADDGRRASRGPAPRFARLLPARHAGARAARGVLRPLRARLAVATPQRFAMRPHSSSFVAAALAAAAVAPRALAHQCVRDRVRRRAHGRGRGRSHASVVAEPAHSL